MSASGPALLLVLRCWTVLATCAVGSGAGGAWAAPLGFGVCSVLVLRAAPRLAFGPTSSRIIGLGFVAGLCSYAAWTATIAWIGTAAGLAPMAEPGRSVSSGWLCAFTLVGLAPVFEEILYRGHLDRGLGALPAPVRWIVCSACFALPHCAPWPWLGTFLVGLALGITRTLTGSLALCIAAHAGLNAAALLRSESLAGGGALSLGTAAFVAALGLCREKAPGGVVHVG